MKNLKISKKFLVTFGIILILFLVSAGISVVSLTSIAGNFTDFYESPYRVNTEVAEMRRVIQSSAKYIGYATMSEDLSQTEQYIELAQDDIDVINEGIEFLYANFQGDKALIDAVKTTLTNSEAAREKVFINASTNNNGVAISAFFNEFQPYLLEANTALTAISDIASENATDLYEESSANVKSTLFLLVASLIVTFALTILMAVYITKSLTKPILEIEGAAKRLAVGDLNIEIGYVSHDELGSLAQSTRGMADNLKSVINDMGRGLGEVAGGNFDISANAEYNGDFIPLKESLNTICASLSETLGQINQASDQVSDGSEQVSSGAQTLSQGTTEQASSIEELSATINEISEQIKENAKNAENANTLSVEAGDETTAGNEKMQDMIKAMEAITENSNEIGKIIKTIDDIAFQTNILALNAAVEAARAGEAGKGFAVVADEVRNLAGKSAEAAKDTTELIQNAIEAVTRGTSIADDTAESLSVIVQKVGQVSDTIRHIAKASDEQAVAISQVTQGVEQISSVVQSNAATAEESAAASEELSAQSTMLKELVSKFNLKQA